MSARLEKPSWGETITMNSAGLLAVPDRPVIIYIVGDGTGPDIWQASQPVFDAAVERAYLGRRKIAWARAYAGLEAAALYGDDQGLPEDTLEAIQEYRVAIKGPLTTQVGRGARSVNVALRQALDLYACVRPVRYFAGVPSRVKHPEEVDMVIFRENTEDIYAGIEWPQGSAGAQRILTVLREEFPDFYQRVRFPETTGIGIKPISKEGSQRIARAAINYALEHHRRSITFVHKGNIMKFTEGAFRDWGYDVAETEFADKTFSWRQWESIKAAQGEAAANQAQEQALAQGKLLIKDTITDNFLQQIITRPAEYDLAVTMNLNGDYVSDALAAQVGGIGIAPGSNINYLTGHAVFEATHGTAPKYAGQDKVNPASVILSGEMMLRYLGWHEAADLIIRGMEKTFAEGLMTYDLERQRRADGLPTTLLKTSEFGQALIERME